MELAELIENWLTENEYTFSLVNFVDCKCVVIYGSNVSVILGDRVHISANEAMYASDPKFFEKFKTWIGTNHPAPLSRGTTLCLECSAGPHHPHPYIGHHQYAYITTKFNH